MSFKNRKQTTGYTIEEIEGIGTAFAAKLATANIVTTDDLLELCSSKQGRENTSEQTGVGEGLILKWANLADLMRISGIGSEYSELLEASGVDTVKELQHRNADNLSAKMEEVNNEKKLTRVVPAASVVARWIDQAKTTTPLITH